jgi:tetratricopeptide (TPR) repeat protein
MSLIASFTKKSKLNATIEQTEKARKSEGNTADALFKAAYQGYAEVLLDDPLRADALYNWGFALLHQAKSKAGDEAARIYQEAIDKFAFCMLINPNYLGAAINGGVAYMDLARLKKAKPDDELYEKAKKQFEKANAIQAGTASYNLACICGLRGEGESCLKALENARDKVTLPETSEILNDPDLDSVKEQAWFIEFMESLHKNAVAEPEETISQPVSKKKWVLVDRATASDESDTDQDTTALENHEVEETK